VERLEVWVAEQAAVPEASTPMEAAGGRGRGRGRAGVQRVVRPGVGAAAAVLRAVVPHLEGVEEADGGVELEVAAAGPRGLMDAVAVGAQYLAEGWGGLGPRNTLFFQLHVINPRALVHLARRTPRDSEEGEADGEARCHHGTPRPCPLMLPWS